jgi:hypothetical protein
MLALHLLQSALVLVNTRMVDRVLDSPDWAAGLTEHDLRGSHPVVPVERGPARTVPARPRPTPRTTSAAP